jgi:hypothetical protein
VAFNHAAEERTFRFTPNVPEGWTAEPVELTVASLEEGRAAIHVTPGESGLTIVTADVEMDGRVLREWTEAIVEVQ